MFAAEKLKLWSLNAHEIDYRATPQKNGKQVF